MRSSLVVAALAIAGACYRDARPSRPAAPPPPPPGPSAARFAADPLAFLPVAADAIAHVDADQLRRSPNWVRVEPLLRGRIGTVVADFQAVCGFDPVAAVRGITVGIEHLDRPEQATVVVVRGLDRAALLACLDRVRAQPAGAAAFTVDGGIVTVPGAAGKPPTVLGFADATTLVLTSGAGASPAALRAVLARGVPLRRSPSFMELFAHVEHRRALWFVFNGTAKAFDQAAAMGMRPRAIFGAVDVAAGFDGSVRLRLESAETAAQLAAMVQGQLGAVQAFVTRVEARAEDRDVVIGLALSPDQVDALMGIVGPTLGIP